MINKLKKHHDQHSYGNERTTESETYIRVGVRNRWSKALTFSIRGVIDDQCQQPSDYMNSRKMLAVLKSSRWRLAGMDSFCEGPSVWPCVL